DMDIEADEEEEEEHPAPADSVVDASTAADQASSAEETEPFETDKSAATPPPYLAYRMTARISILAPLPSASRKEDILKVTLPPRKKLGIALGPRYEVGESSSAAAARPAGGLRADYGFVATMDREIMRDPERERVRQDTDEIYMRLDDEQTERQLLAGRLNMLFRDRRTHAYTRHLMETEARMSREAWVRSTDASDLIRSEVMSLRTTVLGQMIEIRELHAADRRRQIVISELLRADHKRSTEIIELRTALQGQVTALQGQVTTLQAQVTALQGQHGLAGGPTQPELPEEAGHSTSNSYLKRCNFLSLGNLQYNLSCLSYLILLSRPSNVKISSLVYMYFFVDQTPLPIIVMTMATTIDQQTALDESLVPSSKRLRIGRSNFRLPSDIQSKEATLQVVYDATAKLHHKSIRFKIDTRKSVLDLEAFREMLHISPRIPNQPFADLPTEEETLDFLRFLGHSHDIRYLTDVNVNKLYQPWRSFASVINKCLTGKSSSVDSFRLSQAQML
nr:hypothetical protein [Tanacetum cinerariifolium]